MASAPQCVPAALLHPFDDRHSWFSYFSPDGDHCDDGLYAPPDNYKRIHTLAEELIDKHTDDAFIGSISVPNTAEEGFLELDVLDEAGIDLPLDPVMCAALYGKLERSMVGVEGRGTVLDDRLRRSVECPIIVPRHAAENVKQGAADIAESAQLRQMGCILPEPLSSFGFPEALQDIHRRMCPTSSAIRVVPYKLVMYGPGDFFGLHVDTISNPNHFGTISLLLPVARPPPGWSLPEDLSVPHQCDAHSMGSSDSGGLRIYPSKQVMAKTTPHDAANNEQNLFRPGHVLTNNELAQVKGEREVLISPTTHQETYTVSLDSYTSTMCDPASRYLAWTFVTLCG